MDRQEFAARLKKLRTERGISQAILAEALYIDRTTLAGYETGKRLPDVEMICAIADYFQVSADYLLGREKGDI